MLWYADAQVLLAQLGDRGLAATRRQRICRFLAGPLFDQRLGPGTSPFKRSHRLRHARQSCRCSGRAVWSPASTGSSRPHAAKRGRDPSAPRGDGMRGFYRKRAMISLRNDFDLSGGESLGMEDCHLLEKLYACEEIVHGSHDLVFLLLIRCSRGSSPASRGTSWRIIFFIAKRNLEVVLPRYLLS